MKITVENTPKITEHNGQRARIWKGHTSEGVPVNCYICWISPLTHDRVVNDRFAAELNELFPAAQPDKDATP